MHLILFEFGAFLFFMHFPPYFSNVYISLSKEINMKVVQQGTDWKLLHLQNREYEIHRTDGKAWFFFTGLFADSDNEALQKAVDVVTTADKKAF